jgi:hypothetical protein
MKRILTGMLSVAILASSCVYAGPKRVQKSQDTLHVEKQFAGLCGVKYGSNDSAPAAASTPEEENLRKKEVRPTYHGLARHIQRDGFSRVSMNVFLTADQIDKLAASTKDKKRKAEILSWKKDSNLSKINFAITLDEMLQVGGYTDILKSIKRRQFCKRAAITTAVTAVSAGLAFLTYRSPKAQQAIKNLVVRASKASQNVIARASRFFTRKKAAAVANNAKNATQTIWTQALALTKRR